MDESVVEEREMKNSCIQCGKILDKFFGYLSKTFWPQNGKIIHENAKLGEKVFLAPGVIIGSNVTIGNNVSIAPNTVIANTIIKNNVTIGANCTIGLPGYGFEKDDKGVYHRFPHIGSIIIEDDVEV